MFGTDDHQGRMINPTTGTREDFFRKHVREALGLAWDARDEVIIARIEQLKRCENPYAEEETIPVRDLLVKSVFGKA